MVWCCGCLGEGSACWWGFGGGFFWGLRELGGEGGGGGWGGFEV